MNLQTHLRMLQTRLLIRAAMKTCVMGFCHDHLVEALGHEREKPDLIAEWELLGRRKDTL